MPLGDSQTDVVLIETHKQHTGDVPSELQEEEEQRQAFNVCSEEQQDDSDHDESSFASSDYTPNSSDEDGSASESDWSTSDASDSSEERSQPSLTHKGIGRVLTATSEVIRRGREECTVVDLQMQLQESSASGSREPERVRALVSVRRKRLDKAETILQELKGTIDELERTYMADEENEKKLGPLTHLKVSPPENGPDDDADHRTRAALARFESREHYWTLRERVSTQLKQLFGTLSAMETHILRQLMMDSSPHAHSHAHGHDSHGHGSHGNCAHGHGHGSHGHDSHGNCSHGHGHGSHGNCSHGHGHGKHSHADIQTHAHANCCQGQHPQMQSNSVRSGHDHVQHPEQRQRQRQRFAGRTLSDAVKSGLHSPDSGSGNESDEPHSSTASNRTSGVLASIASTFHYAKSFLTHSRVASYESCERHVSRHDSSDRDVSTGEFMFFVCLMPWCMGGELGELYYDDDGDIDGAD